MVAPNNAALATARRYKLVTDGDHKARLLGTCFAYAHPKYYLTAGHCIGGLAPEQLVIAGEDRRWAGAVKRISYHDAADIAILEHERGDLPIDTPNYFRGVHRPQMGMDFFAYGYPELGLDEKVSPRVFHGIFQRFHDHTSHMHRRNDPAAPPYRYWAGELSIPCPAGLSGGPVSTD